MTLLETVNAKLDALEPRVTTLEAQVADMPTPAEVEAVAAREQSLEDRVAALETFFPANPIDTNNTETPSAPSEAPVTVDSAPTETASDAPTDNTTGVDVADDSVNHVVS